jgi:biotin carboxyl carrier protein
MRTIQVGAYALGGRREFCLPIFCLRFRAIIYADPVEELAKHTATISELAALLDRHGLTEIELQSGELQIRLSREPDLVGERVAGASVSAVVEHALVGEPLEAPFMGVFYRAPRPNEPPFVEEGDTVEEGHPLCMIEANKVFSELTAHVAGRITGFGAENGALVHPGEALVYIEPSVVAE